MMLFSNILKKETCLNWVTASIPHVACICFFQAYNGMYARSMLRCSLICFQIMNLHPSRIYVILYSKSFIPKAVGTYLKTTVVLSADDEKKLWDTNVMNLKTSIGFLRVVFFPVMGKIFACGVVLSSTILNYHSFTEKLL